MTDLLSVSTLFLIGFCILAEAGREICFKKGANKSGDFIAIIIQPIVILGMILWGVELIAWTNVLEHTNLSIAFPIMSLSYVAITLLGAAVFHEKLNAKHIVGALLITAGVSCIGVTGL